MRMSRFETYKRADNQWDWRLVARNNRIIATSGGQGYRSEFEALRALDAVLRAFASEPLVVTS